MQLKQISDLERANACLKELSAKFAVPTKPSANDPFRRRFQTSQAPAPRSQGTIRLVDNTDGGHWLSSVSVERYARRFPPVSSLRDGRKRSLMAQVRFGIIGAGAVSDYHHVPGIRVDPRAELVAVCDPHEPLLDSREQDWGVAREKLYTNVEGIAHDPDVDAVIIATPNDTHYPLAMACIAAGKHVMCEKPLGLNFAQSAEMYRAARDKGVKHMTAFTYRFAPSMRYLRHLVKSGLLGEPRHFRSQRFLDLPETSWGWRQYKARAGAGDLFDMTIHRIDLAMDLIGPLTAVCGAVAQFAPRETTADGQSCPPSEVDDWSALIGRFENGAVGVWEGSTVMKGYQNNGFGHEWAEVNGTEGSAVYRLQEPNVILVGKSGETMQPLEVPDEYLVIPGSPRDPRAGVPSTVFRYDLVYELVSAIVEDRPAVPGFDHGAAAQAVADAVLESNEAQRWVSLNLSLG